MAIKPIQRATDLALATNDLLRVISRKRFGFPLFAKLVEPQVFVVLTLLGSEDEVHIDRQVLNLPDLIADNFTTPTAQTISYDRRAHLTGNREAITKISSSIGDKNDR
jgi:hypothetical protein